MLLLLLLLLLLLSQPCATMTVTQYIQFHKRALEPA